MIYCPNCGTSNRKGSRFCSECGESLPSTGTRCPMCDTVNPIGHVYCQQCNARLVPMSAAPGDGSEEKTRPIKGFSLPTIPLDEEAGDHHEHVAEPPEPEESPSDAWLNELRGSADQETGSAEDVEQAEDEPEPPQPADIPSWLSDMGPISEAPADSTDAEAPPADEAAAQEDAVSEQPPEEDLEADAQPSAGAPAEADASEADVAPSPEEEITVTLEPARIPDWLRELGPVSEETPPFPDDELPTTWGLSGDEIDIDDSAAEERDLSEPPEWLRDILFSDEEDTMPSEPEEAPLDASRTAEEEPTVIEIPDWLKEGRSGAPPRPPEEAEETEAETETSAPQASPSESVEIPSWLQEAEAEAEIASSEEPAAPLIDTPAETLAAPDWLTDLVAPSTEEKEEAPPSPAEPGIAEETWGGDLERADIPEWLQQLRPGHEADEEILLGPMETEGVLMGLRGLIPADHTISAPTAFEPSSAPGSSEASLARAELLQGLLGQPTVQPATVAPPETVARSFDTGTLVERWLIVGILITAVLGMLLAPVVTGQTPNLTEPLTAAEATNLHRVVDELDGGDHVLVAFDYGPAEADELSAVAEPVLKHVLDQGAQLSIVSTRPDGPLMASAAMNRIGDSEDQYTLIGYRPGRATAMSQVLASTNTAPTLLLVLTSRPARLRLWIEQANAQYGDGLPVAAVGSAAVEPVASPYLDANAGQLRAAVHGLRGAAAYEAIRGASSSATQSLDALAAGHLAIVLLIVIGALVHALAGAKEEEI